MSEDTAAQAESYSYDDLMETSLNYLTESMESEAGKKDPVLVNLSGSRELLDKWKEVYAGYMHTLADADDAADQFLRLRRLLVEQIEASIYAQNFLKDELTLEDKQTIAERLYSDMDYEQAFQLNCQLYLLSETSCRCLRKISQDFSDLKKNDWFTLYCDLYNRLAGHIYKFHLSQQKDRDYLLAPLVEPLKKIVDRTREDILAGQNWSYRGGIVEGS